MGVLGRMIIQITSFFDFYITLILGKNDILLLHQKIYRGNFIFNKSVTKVDHGSIEQEVQLPSLRKNILLGASLNALGEGFVMNAPINFSQLSDEQKINLIYEAVRRQPVVAGTHRVVEAPEDIVIAGKIVTLDGGDIVTYPLVCANMDTKV